MINYVLRIFLAALIGYCTNYIAIKMLFRPRKEIRIAGIRVPFTPGIIPKNKPRIAKSIADAVSRELITTEDLKKRLSSDDIENALTNRIISEVYNNNLSLKINAQNIIGSESIESFSVKLEDFLTSRVTSAISNIDINEILKEEVVPIITQKLKSNMMLAMFIKDSMIESFIEPISQSIKKYIDLHAEEKVRPYIKNEIVHISSKTYSEILTEASITNDVLEKVIKKIYEEIICSKASKMIEKLNISEIVEEKINNMNVSEIEDLVMSVMKNELQAVVNLGAVIGACIGILNIFL